MIEFGYVLTQDWALCQRNARQAGADSVFLLDHQRLCQGRRGAGVYFVLKIMDFVFKMMNSVLKMMDFAFKTMDF